MTTSDRFILSLFPPPAGREDQLRQLSRGPGFDWKSVEIRSVAWGLAPLVHYRLVESGLDRTAPAKMVQHLKEIRRFTAVRNSLLDRELERIAIEFDRAGVPAIALKGADLTRTVYPDRSLRISLDVDLLVARDAVDRAEAALRELGYSPAVPIERDWYEDNLHHGVPWKAADGGVTVEVHWTLVRSNDPFRVDVPGLWSRARPLPVGRAALLRLSTKDCAEFLAVHFFRHLTTPDGAFRSLADMTLLLDAADGRSLDWDRLRSEATRRGTGLPIALALRLVDETWPERGLATIADSFEAAVRDRGLLRRSRELAGELFRLPAGQPPAIVSGMTRLGQERGAPRKIRFMARGLFPRPAHLNRDLTTGQSRWPVFLRYPALAFNYARELTTIGPRAALSAYRLGRLRQEMEKELE